MSNQIQLLGFAILAACFSGKAAAQATYGFATLPPGSLLHTQASVIAKVVQDNVGSVQAIRDVAKESGIYVFPGFEITSPYIVTR